MKSQEEVLEEMQKGFETLEEFCAKLNLSFKEKLKVRFYIFAISLYRIFILPFKKRKQQHLIEELRKYTNIPLNIKRTKLKAAEDNHYLTEKEIQDFERNGLVKPFKAISRLEAKALRDLIEGQFEKDFDGKSCFSKEIKDILKEHGVWNITSGGLHQALYIRAFRDLLRRPAIAHRLASLLGEEVICWRSQFFEKKPGSVGTYWHQNSLFREVSKQEKLVPTQPIDQAVTQLTAWVALSDVTLKNGALRIMPGTLNDARIEYMYSFTQDNLIFFLSQVPKHKLNTLLKAAFFSTGSFIRSQVVFTTVTDYLDNVLEDKEILNLEMKAGECVIFTSLNMHASFPNITKDDTRLAFVGRCTPNHVKVFPNTKMSTYATPEGVKEFKLPDITNFQVHGQDSYGFNKVLKEKELAVQTQ